MSTGTSSSGMQEALKERYFDPQALLAEDTVRLVRRCPLESASTHCPLAFELHDVQDITLLPRMCAAAAYNVSVCCQEPGSGDGPHSPLRRRELWCGWGVLAFGSGL